MGQRIRALRLQQGLSQQALGDKIGRSKGTVSQWEAGTTHPGGEVLLRLATVLRRSPHYLATGAERTAETPASYQAESHSNVEGPAVGVSQGRVPVKGSAQLGPCGYFEALDYPVEQGDGYVMVESQDADAYGLRVVGNSMMPRIKHHEYVVIEPNHPYVNGDEVLVCTRDGQCMIKVFTWLRDGQYRFDSINNDFEPLHVFEEEVMRIHYVGAIVKPSRYMP
ncbi:XRE family transcriptional regulator [Halomonas getboli]|uniref:XRE family transcriptional regulator n=1 Tax=Halomonas getboli TaxID=2935862 RepID=UPI00200002D5|nr:S24 family peptidase [Halomonas getboli]MCK2183537.1 helix-turn-helix domain-containing protein [Halomonas getboli]